MLLDGMHFVGGHLRRIDLREPYGKDIGGSAWTDAAKPRVRNHGGRVLCPEVVGLKVPGDGIEPPTQGFSVLRSTD